MQKIKNKFDNFIEEIKSLNDTEKVKFKLDENGSNFIIMSGEISERTTEDNIRNLGQKYSFQIMANEFSRPVL